MRSPPRKHHVKGRSGARLLFPDPDRRDAIVQPLTGAIVRGKLQVRHVLRRGDGVVKVFIISIERGHPAGSDSHGRYAVVPDIDSRSRCGAGVVTLETWPFDASQIGNVLGNVSGRAEEVRVFVDDDP